MAEFQQRALRGPIQILDQSYRLPELIWRYSHALSGRIRKRQAKTWQSRGGGGDLSEVGALAGIDFTTPGSWMVLSRTKYGAKEVADLLGARGIPHTLFGSDMVNPRDILAIDAWERLQGGRAVLWEQAYELVKRLRPAVVDTHAIKKMDQYSENDAFTLEELRDGLGFKADITRLWYDTHQQDFKLPTSRVALYRTLINGGWDLHQPSRVHINTMHGVKGGEADHVVLLPSLSRRMYVAATRGGNADDEHRVHYVAATRARQSLRIANVAAQYRYPYPRVAA